MRQVLSNEFVRALPAARGYGNYLAGVPGISGTGLGASATPSNNFFTSRGGRSSEGNIQLDGMNVGSSVGGGGVSGYQYDMSNASEVQVTIAGGLAEVDRGGPAFNMIPKTGGNTFSGIYFGSLAGEWAQGSNIDDELRSYGFTDLAALITNWDTNFAFSGPILRDRIWFYTNARTVGTYQDVPNLYGNVNASNPNNWTYVKDDQREGPQRHLEEDRRDAPHLAGVAAQQVRVLHRLHEELLRLVVRARMAASAARPATAGPPRVRASALACRRRRRSRARSGTRRAKIMQATYTAPISSRVLVEAGFSSFWTEWGDIRPAGAADESDCGDRADVDDLTGTPTSNFIYHGWPTTSGTIQQNAQYRGVAVVCDRLAHLKSGYQGAYMVAKTPTFVGQQISYRFNNGVPNQLTAAPRADADEQPVAARRPSSSQDQWTRGAADAAGRPALRARAQFLPRR